MSKRATDSTSRSPEKKAHPEPAAAAEVSCACTADASASDCSCAASAAAPSVHTRRSRPQAWEVERIIASRCRNPSDRRAALRAAAGRLEELEFLVQWAGFDASQRSWITADNFAGGLSSPMLLEFMEAQRRDDIELRDRRELLAAMRILRYVGNEQDKEAVELFESNLSLATLVALERLSRIAEH